MTADQRATSPAPCPGRAGPCSLVVRRGQRATAMPDMTSSAPKYCGETGAARTRGECAVARAREVAACYIFGKGRGSCLHPAVRCLEKCAADDHADWNRGLRAELRTASAWAIWVGGDFLSAQDL